MTNELEKQFFQCFGIEPRVITEPRYSLNSEYYEATVENYPQINDRILLELICIATASEITVEFKGIKNVEHLKEVVLNYCTKRYGYCLHKDKFKQQVRTLFEEG